MLAVRALEGSESITELATEHGVSRKFVYEQAHRANVSLDAAFPTAANDDEKVLFEMKVTRYLFTSPHETDEPRRRAAARTARRLLENSGNQAVAIGGSKLRAGPLPNQDPMASFMKARTLRPWRLQVSSTV